MKVVFAGLGSIGQRHLRNLRATLGSDVEVVAVRRRGLMHVLDDRQQITAGAGLHEAYGVTSVATLDEALAGSPDALFVCNPSSMHVEYAAAAVEAGCHVFIEKPLAHDLSGVESLIERLDDKQLAGFVGFQLRFHPAIRKVHELLAADRIGRILAVRVVDAEYLPSWHPYEDYRVSYASQARLGGGVILSRIHEIDYIYSFFGLPRRVVTVGGHLSDLEIDVEDVASSLFTYDTANGRFPLHLHQDMVARRTQRSCEIVGSAGHISMDLVAGTVESSGADGQSEVFTAGDFDRNQLFLDEMTHFLACCRGEAEPIVSLADGLCSLRMALAARESVSSGGAVDIAS